MTERIPDYLGKTGKAVFKKWREIITERTGWRDEYFEVVAVAAAQYELYEKATEGIQREGATIVHNNGARGQNPWVVIQQSAFKNVLLFSNRFGLNPQYSAKVDLSGAYDDSEI